MVLLPTFQFIFSTWKLWEEPKFFWEVVVTDLLLIMVGRSLHFFYFSAIFMFILVSISLTIAASFFFHMSLWPFALLCHFTRRLLEEKWNNFIFFECMCSFLLSILLINFLHVCSLNSIYVLDHEHWLTFNVKSSF